MLNRYSVPESVCRRKTYAVLTDTSAMKVKPGLGNAPDVEIQYKLCNSVVSPSASIEASGSGTHPNEAIYKTRLDEQSEDPIDPHKSPSFTQVIPY